MEEFCGSPFWDTELTWNTNDPDFTPCFQQTALVWTPFALLVILSPLDIYYTRTSKYSNIPWGLNNVGRIFLILLLTVHSLVDLITALTWMSHEIYTVHIVTPAVRSIMFLLLAIWTHFHRDRGITSSSLLTLFWICKTVFAVPEFRHHIRMLDRISNKDWNTWEHYQLISFSVYFGLLLLLTGFYFFVDRKPLRSNYEHIRSDKPNPCLRSSFMRHLMFSWFDLIVWQGYRSPLRQEDMYDVNPEDTSSELNRRFRQHWHNDVAKQNIVKRNQGNSDENSDTTQKETNGNIVTVLWNTFCGPFLMAGLLKLIIDLLSFAPPQILGLIIWFIAVPSTPQWHGFVFTLVFLVISLVTALLNTHHQYLCYMVGHRCRVALVNAIYRKSLSLSSGARRTTTTGEIVNLMAVDAQRFYELIIYLHLIWSGPLVVILSMYFLYDLLGVSAFAGLIALVLLIPVNAFIATKLKHLQREQMQHKDDRIRAMNEILGGIKTLKLFAWETSFENSILKMRQKELRIIRQASITNAYVFLMWNMIPFLVTLITFVVFIYADDSNQMTPNTLFVALSLFNILRVPMTMFPQMVTQVMQVWVAVQRINKYLNQEELNANAVSHSKDVDALKITNGNFTWNSMQGNAVLKGINMIIRKGHLSVVAGPVGSGKSSLISSFLGDTQKLTGTVNINGSLAYVSQQAWIQNATFQDNILFGLPMETAFYNKVLEACALLPDLAILAAGDQTEIGEKGINLSGGQKQRIALARAVYSRADVYLLDDPLSSVDSHVGRHIFDKVIGSTGLLAGKTRLLVTHGIAFLSQSDTIFVLSNGEISEHGQYSALLQRKGSFAEFIMQQSQEIKTKYEDRIISTQTSSIEKRQSSKSVLEPKSNSSSNTQNTINPEMKLIKKEGIATGSAGIVIYWRYMKSVGYIFCILSIFGTIAHHVLSIYANYFLSEWSIHPEVNDPGTRALYLSVFGGLGILQGVTLFVASIITAYGTVKAAQVLHNRMLHRTMRLPMEFFDTTPLGRITNRFSKDVDIVDNVLPQLIRSWLIIFFGTAGTLIVISYSTHIFIAMIIPLAILYHFIQKFYVATSRQLKRIESVSRSPIYSHFSETINGHTTIRAFNAQTRFHLDSERLIDKNQKSVYASLVAARWLGVRLEFLGALILLFASLFAILARDTIPGELVGLSITYAMQITATLKLLIRLSAELETNIVANERLEEYANEPVEAAWETDVKINKKWPSNGAIRFEAVDLRYRQGLELVLKKVSFDIRGGEKIGIVGRTGAGKSSLVLALFRIIEVVGGKIFINDIPIDTLGLQQLRSHLTIIPQDPVLFGGTLRNNVDPFEMFTDEEVWNAIERSQLREFVLGTPLGLLHEISEGGENLSIGQRQLVCLARALLRRTKVLILDEATAAIDLETDHFIQTTIRKEFKECTVLTIAHRLNTILDSDRVLILDKGEVAELDSPQSLLKNEHSIFYAMAKEAGVVNNITFASR